MLCSSKRRSRIDGHPRLLHPPVQSRSKLYSWKALRAVARSNLQAFSAVSAHCSKCFAWCLMSMGRWVQWAVARLNLQAFSAVSFAWCVLLDA